MAGFIKVEQQNRVVIERFGKFLRVAGPGLRWLMPVMDSVKDTVPLWRVQISLFEKPTKIDFADGSAFIIGAEAYVQIFSPDIPYDAGDGKRETGILRAVYEVDAWRIYIKNLLENAIRSYLNGLTIDVGITEKEAGYDLKNRFPEDERIRIIDALRQIGFELVRITIVDFDLDSSLVQAREKRHLSQKQAEAAVFDAKTRATETAGTVIAAIARIRGKTEEEIQAEIDASSEAQEKLQRLVNDLITRKMSLEEGALVDIHVDGAEGIEHTLLNLTAALQRMPQGKTPAVAKRTKRQIKVLGVPVEIDAEEEEA
jgi:regulator of protease activity HflC (stomatin/prohibitin superfamily)